MKNDKKLSGLEVKVTAKSVYKRNILLRVTLITITVILLFLSITYAFLYMTQETGYFTIELDPNLKANNSLLMSASSDFDKTPLTLKMNTPKSMDNISERWLPDDIDDIEGPHSKDNYIAYTFFIKNIGTESIDYMTEIEILSVIKNVDEAIRVAVYKNGVKTVYAKKNAQTNKPEPNTVEFASATNVMKEKQKGLKPKKVDKYTIVIWLEGDDPDCINDIMGGVMKMRMLITETKPSD